MKEGEVRRRNRIFCLSITFSAVYLFWRLFCTLPWGEGIFQVLAGLLLLLAETVTAFGTAELMVGRMKSEGASLSLPQVPPEAFPEVDVLIATHNEPTGLLYKTVNACTFLEYPDSGKVHIYVCDDGGRDSVRRMTEELKVGYIGMKENVHAKAGNYNHALARTTSPLVATFDADMIPRRQFLMRTVPYFQIPQVRMELVQTPQSFYNQDLFQFNLYAEKGIPNEQDFFSREINLLRNATNTAAYTGSNTVILRAALEEIGGFPWGTVTEDFETSLRLQKAGYVTYATREVLAAGLSTTTVGSMIRQRIRWARGVIQSIQNTNAIFTRKLSLSARLSYLNAWLYWWSFLCRMVFILAPYLVFPVLAESLGIHEKRFLVTDKKRRREKTATFPYLIPHGILILLTVAAIFRFARGKYGLALLYSSVILFWLGYNLTALVYAVFFMLGRESRRISDRIGAREQARLVVEGRALEGETLDVSEEGIALLIAGKEGEARGLPKPGDRFEVTVTTTHYQASLKAVCVYAGKGKVTATVEPADEKSRHHWLQIIHDREHSLPRELDPWMTVYDEIRQNVLARWKRKG